MAFFKGLIGPTGADSPGPPCPSGPSISVLGKCTFLDFRKSILAASGLGPQFQLLGLLETMEPTVGSHHFWESLWCSWIHKDAGCKKRLGEKAPLFDASYFRVLIHFSCSIGAHDTLSWEPLRSPTCVGIGHEVFFVVSEDSREKVWVVFFGAPPKAPEPEPEVEVKVKIEVEAEAEVDVGRGTVPPRVATKQLRCPATSTLKVPSGIDIPSRLASVTQPFPDSFVSESRYPFPTFVPPGSPFPPPSRRLRSLPLNTGYLSESVTNRSW